MTEHSGAGSASTGRRMQRRSLDTRRRLVDAAVAAFAEAGYAGAATRDIAERAGVHHPLITYHFRNKERLWQAAADRLFGELTERLEHAVSDAETGDDRQRMTSAIRTLTLYSAEHPEWYHFVRDATAENGDRATWLSEHHMRRLFGLLVPLLESLQSTGDIPSREPAQVCIALLGATGCAVSFGAQYEQLTGRNVLDGGAAGDYADYVIRLFLGPQSG